MDIQLAIISGIFGAGLYTVAVVGLSMVKAIIRRLR